INNGLEFTVRNSVVDGEQNNEKGGIGLANIKKRLDLNYQNNYKLTIDLEDNWYIVNLSIFNLRAIQNA
ncbi:MAG: hypothetical protein RBT49_07795, partial [Bacteroidales bacterium]|nr:hypothetical protein [Bacteroidales bacterium]